MTSIPTKVIDRFKDNIPKLQKILESAKNRDVNEADTVQIVSDIMVDVFGFDKYNEITREFVIKGTYCDLAIKVDSKVEFLIEVKAVGINLQEKHYQQVLEYGAKEGIEWIILTNGLIWKIYKVKFEKPIGTDFVSEFNFTDIKPKNVGDLDKLFILCKEGLKKNAIDEFAEYKLSVNKYYIGAILQNNSIVEIIKKELKRINPNVKPDNYEIKDILKNEVIKRELIDSPEANDALAKYEKIIKKADKHKSNVAKANQKSAPKPKPGESIAPIEEKLQVD